jgi:hypothetical protein
VWETVRENGDYEMRNISEKYFLKLAKKLKTGKAIGQRIGRTRQAVNARLRRLGLAKPSIIAK